MSDSSSANLSIGQMLFTKPVVAGAIAGALDHYVLQNSDIKSNAVFGASVGAGTFLADTFAGSLGSSVGSNLFGDSTLYNGSTLTQRVIEIAGGSVGSYVANRFLLKNDYVYSQVYQKIGVVAVSQIASIYLIEYMGGRTLSYLM